MQSVAFGPEHVLHVVLHKAHLLESLLPKLPSGHWGAQVFSFKKLPSLQAIQFLELTVQSPQLASQLTHFPVSRYFPTEHPATQVFDYNMNPSLQAWH